MSETTWTDIEKTFDNITDMNLRVYFLRDLISQMSICNEKECEIYPSLHQLKSHTKNLREYGFFMLSDAKKIINEIFRKQFIDLMRELESESESVFSKIFALYTIKKNKDLTEQTRHNRMIELMKVMIQSNIPVPFEIQTEVDQYINSIDGNSEAFKKAQAKMVKQAK
jgi:hypothetical protein